MTEQRAVKNLEYNQLVEERNKTAREAFLFDSANINMINPYEKKNCETIQSIETKTEDELGKVDKKATTSYKKIWKQTKKDELPFLTSKYEIENRATLTYPELLK